MRRRVPTAPGSDLLALAHWRWAGRQLALQSQGLASAGPAWLHPGAVRALQIALPGASGNDNDTTITVGLADGAAAGSIPGRLGRDGPRLAVQRMAPLQLQSRPPILGAALTPALRGTTTALLADLLSPRQFLLTCGHVAAASPAAAVNQRIDIQLADGAMLVGRLVDWQPALGTDVLRTGLDAALVELTQADAHRLRAVPGWLPTGVNGRPLKDMPVTLRRADTPLGGRLRIFWSGYVDVPGLSPGVADYFLEGGIGWLSAAPTLGGDSGAAVWDDQDRLLGMHIGALPGAQGNDANAVYAPIQPVLDWYSVQPQLRSGAGIRVAAAAAPRTAAPVLAITGLAGGFPASDLEVVACTLWGEARNQGEDGMRAVASVIENRRKAGYRRKTTAADVCLDRWQFSCWNDGDPNLGRMRQVVAAPDVQYRQALVIADEVLRRALSDCTRQARHYFASSLSQPPYWARGKSPCIVIGDHLFFNDID